MEEKPVVPPQPEN